MTDRGAVIRTIIRISLDGTPLTDEHVAVLGWATFPYMQGPQERAHSVFLLAGVAKSDTKVLSQRIVDTLNRFWPSPFIVCLEEESITFELSPVIGGDFKFLLASIQDNRPRQCVWCSFKRPGSNRQKMIASLSDEYDSLRMCWGDYAIERALDTAPRIICSLHARMRLTEWMATLWLRASAQIKGKKGLMCSVLRELNVGCNATTMKCSMNGKTATNFLSLVEDEHTIFGSTIGSSEHFNDLMVIHKALWNIFRILRQLENDELFEIAEIRTQIGDFVDEIGSRCVPIIHSGICSYLPVYFHIFRCHLLEFVDQFSVVDSFSQQSCEGLNKVFRDHYRNVSWAPRRARTASTVSNQGEFEQTTISSNALLRIVDAVLKMNISKEKIN